MKGTPAFPQCGFSHRVVQILRHYGVEFASANVLEDTSIREGIKEYSNWPTIPQLYVEGEFVGGCDILMELHERGELASVLKQAGDAERADLVPGLVTQPSRSRTSTARASSIPSPRSRTTWTPARWSSPTPAACACARHDGREYIDAMAGLWCVNVGYGRRELVEAMTAQASACPTTTRSRRCRTSR